MTPIRLPLKAYLMLTGAALAGSGILVLTYPPDRVIGLMFEADEEFARAITFFSAWNARHPTDYEARWHTIELLLATARPEDAVARLEEMNAKWPDDARVVARLAEVYDGLLDVERSMTWTEKLSKLRPDDAQTLQKLVNFYRWYGKTAELILALERYVDLSPSPDEHRELTDLLIAQKRFDQVIAYNQKYIERHPEAVEPHLALYQAYLHMGKTELALKELKEVMRIQPQAEETQELSEDKLDLADKLFELRIQELVASGDGEAAIKLYRARIAQNPTSIPLRLHLAELYGKHTDEVAAQELKEVTKLTPNAYPAWKALGLRYAWTGKPKEAIEAFERAVALEPDQIATRRALAEQYAWSDRHKDAVEQYRWIVAHQGTQQDRAALVASLVELKRYAEAIPEAKELVKRSPKKENYRLLAKAAIAAKKCSAVMSELEDLTRRFEDDSEAWSLFGLCAKQEGRQQEALEALDKASKLHAEPHDGQKVRGHAK
jgi:tetratricopeptide (TPR) repeat protein